MAGQPHPDVFNVPEKERVVSKNRRGPTKLTQKPRCSSFYRADNARASSQTAGEIVEGFQAAIDLRH